ncbi:MAG: GAF domain-containing protein [Anaerolineales bacterium]|nr:GAF domain-containing protein [Anaerolineales bacterium]
MSAENLPPSRPEAWPAAGDGRPAPPSAAPPQGAADQTPLSADPLGVTPGWSWEIDALGAYTACSPEIVALLGIAPDSLIGQPLTQMAAPADSSARHELTNAISGRRPILDVRLTARHRDGRDLLLVLNALPKYDNADQFAGYRGIAQLLWTPDQAPPGSPAVPEIAAVNLPPSLPTPAESHWPAAAAPPAPLAADLPAAGERGRLGAPWGFVAGAEGLAPLEDALSPEAEQALAQGAVVLRAAGPTLASSGPRALAVPIQLQNQTIGVLDFFDEGQARAWSEDDLALVQAVSDQLALALENARLFSETRDYVIKQTLLYDVTRAAASAASLGEALNSAAQSLGRVLPNTDIAILLLDEAGRTLRIRAAVGYAADLGGRLSIPRGQGITGWVAEHNQAVLCADVRQDPRYVAGRAGILSEASVPLALGERVIGVLNIESAEPAAFDQQDLQLLSTLAGTLSAIIVNNHLLEQIGRERERLGVLYDVLQALIARPEREAVLQTALAMAPRLGAQHAYVLLLGERDAQAIFRGTLPGLDQLDERAANAFALTIARRGLERWVLENRRPVVVADTAHDERWHTADSHVEHEPARAVISVPLRTQRGTLTGVLAYTHGLPGALGEEHLPLIESLAGQVAVALENDALRQQQRAQREGAEALARAAQAMTRTLIEADLCQIVVEQLFETYRPNGVCLLRWEAPSQTFLPVAAEKAPSDAEGDPQPWPVVGERFAAARRPDLLEIVRTRHGRIRPLREEPGAQLRESMCLPLVYGGEVEGVVEVIHTGPRRGLGPGDLELFHAILTAAASALQSARLYELQRQTAERLAEVDRLKSQFLANMSHELRTPLNSIIGFSRVILKGIDGPLTDLQAQDLSSINNAGQHLLGLINDILDMARIEAGKMELVLDEVDLHDTLKGVLATTLALVKDKPIRLVEEVAPAVPRVRADSMRIRQVLLNLLSNAAKFTDEGTITLRARPVEAVGPYTGQIEPFVEISVIDTGPGIAPEDMGKLFEQFSQVDASATRKVGGTGLGLSICRQLVELHSGRIWAESEVGRGSTFTFILPVSQPESQGTAPVAELPDPGARLVLAVDDDQGIHNLYRRYLEPHGYKVVGVSKSTEAITRAAELRPVAVLLDVLMPNKDGWQVLADLKRSPVTSDIPVIMCTLVADQQRAQQMGAADYLTKPILEADLVRALTRLPPPLPVPGPASPAKRDVLVIDDRPEDIAYIRRALDPGGAGQAFRVLEARGGQAGLAAARQSRPHAIILDLLMPDMDGFAVLSALRGDPATRDIPVIVVSGAELSRPDRDRLTQHVSALRSKGLLKPEQLLTDLQRALGAGR